MGVDWSSWRPAEACRNAWYEQTSNMLPMIHMNFRVYFEQPEQSDLSNDVEFYTKEERSACERADTVIALTQADLEALQRAGVIPSKVVRRCVLSPPIRADIEAAAADMTATAAPAAAELTDTSTSASISSWVSCRHYVTCCARVCHEKNTLNGFVRIMEKIGSEQMASRNLVPLIFGRQTAPLYAQECIERLRTAFPAEGACAVLPFGGAKEMAEMWSRTRLNVHASVYESYGMVPIEAAAFNVPTICHKGDIESIGFCDLLREEDGQVFRTNLNNIEEAAAAMSVLLGLDTTDDGPQFETSIDTLRATAERAKSKALSWNSIAFAKTLMNIVQETCR